MMKTLKWIAVALLVAVGAQAAIVTDNLTKELNADDIGPVTDGSTWTGTGVSASLNDTGAGLTKAAATVDGGQTSTVFTNTLTAGGYARAGHVGATTTYLTGTTLSVELWINTGFTGIPATSHTIFETGGATRGMSITLGDNGSGTNNTLRFAMKDGSNSAFVDVALDAAAMADFTDGHHHQLAVTYDNVNNMLLYIDGALAGSIDHTGVIDWDGTSIAGFWGQDGSGNGAQALTLDDDLANTSINGKGQGSIAVFRQYSDVLTGAEVLQNYLSTIPNSTNYYVGSGALIDVVYSSVDDGTRGTIISTNSNSWSSGLPLDYNPGLFAGGTAAPASSAAWKVWYGVAVRQTGGTLSDTAFTMRGGAQDGSTTHSTLEIDDASNTGSYTNLAISGQLTMWNQNAAAGATGNTLSLLNGYADVGILAGTSPADITVNILNGRLDVGYLSNARFLVNMLAGGTGEFNLADMYGDSADPDHKSKFKNLILNFEAGSEASFTIASSNVTGSAVGAWEAFIAANRVKIDGVVDNNTNSYFITSTDGTNTTISLDLDPPNPDPATFSSAPSADGITISMTATTGTDAGGPVEYYFAETSGNPGGTDSGWQLSPSYTDGGLDEYTQYTYTVQMRDSATTPNVGAASSPASATTDVYTAADYFIAPTGSDAAGDGSIANPYETITKAQSVASSGDTVYLRGGTYTLDNSDITYSHSAWDSVNHITKNGIRYAAYSDEVPIFDFSAVKPAGRRVTAFLVEADNCVFEGFEVVGVQVTIAAGEASNTQSECFRIVGGDNNRFERLSMHDGMGIGWYLTRGGNNLVINCDAYNNKGLDGLSHGNIDGFGAHTGQTNDTGNTFIGCRAWFNSDDGFDLINNDAAVVISNCWAMYNGYDHESPSSMIGDSTGFKAGGYGVKGNWYPTPVPRNRILYCLAVENGRGFYANHHTGGLDWIGNTAIYNGGNYNMLCNLDATSRAADVPGFDHYMKNNLGFGGGYEVSDLGSTNENDVTYNYWTLPVTVTAGDFKSLSYAELTQPRQADGSLPNVDYARLVEGSDLIDAGTTNLAGATPYYSGSAPDLGAFELYRSGYDTWAGNFPGADLSDPTADYDLDGVVNLMEYALGGNPTLNDAAAVLPVFQPLENHFYYVHNERTDDTNLIYTVQACTNLVSNGWNTNGLEFVGAAGFSNVWEVVTNKVSTLEKDQQFIRLKIEKD